MKKNLMIYGCLSFVLACQGAEKKKSDEPINFSKTSIEQNVEGEKEVENSNEDEIQEISFEEVKENNDEVEKDGNPEVQQNENSDEVASDLKENSLETGINKSETEEIPATDQPDETQQVKSILISIVPDLMKFDKEVFTVAAGQEVIIELDNPDGMQHNMVISKPGTLKEVGEAADALARDPKGAQKHYVPEIPAVLFATKLLEPGDVVTLSFTAPSEPGDYPFVCTFPGHWRMMNGIMKVTK